MVFHVYRTSSIFGDSSKKPCEKAFLMSDKNGQVVWAIEFNSLEDIKELSQEVEEELIFGFNVESGEKLDGFVEIYDYYRE